MPYPDKAKPLDGLLRERPDLPNPNPVRPGAEKRLRNLQRRFRTALPTKGCPRLAGPITRR